MASDLEQRFLDELIDDLEHDRLLLPTLPEVALRVRDAVEDDDASVRQIAAVIATDAAISARLVQVANSPLLRASQPIDSVEAAVTRMGQTMVRDLVTSMAMEQMFQATTDATDRRMRALWEHNTQVAAISHALAKQFSRLSPEQAMLAGLVHDIGALPVLSRAEDVPELLADEALLDRVVGALHPRIGGAILTRWNFPRELVAAAAEHEDIERAGGERPDYVDVVVVANLQSHMGSEHPLAQRDWSSVPAFGKLGLDPQVSVVDMEGTAENIAAVRSALAG